MSEQWGGYRRRTVYSPRKHSPIVRRTPRIRQPRFSAPPGTGRLLLILLAAALGLWWLFGSSTFRVTTVTVDGLSKNRTAQIQEQVKDVVAHSHLLGLRRDSIWLWPTKAVEDRLHDQFPALKDLKVERKPAHTVVIKAREEPAGLIWQSGEASYLVGSGGEAIQLLPKTADITALPRVKDVAAVPVKTGGPVATPEFVSFTREIWKGFKAATGQELAELQITETTLEERALARDGSYVLFDTTRSASRQLGFLKDVMAAVKKQGKSLEYADLRIDGRIFYKTK